MQAFSTATLVLFLMAIIVMMILPVPSFFLDLGLALSFGIAVTVFTLTLFVERPLDFSAFPTMLLGSLMLRLSLNVSSTKLILSQGHTGTDAAGSVIEGFASFIMGGSLLLGIITFLVILIVNFMVITKGAARMAEVGARFALDGMPGRQLAIDADVAAGSLTHDQAKSRREEEQAETSFLGSLDGASKFVKGDAIAGLLITGLNIVAGILVGVLVHGLSAGRAFEVYAILTIGDGLVTQIPAVIISVASGLLLARSGLTHRTDAAIGQQLGKNPQALLLVSGVLIVFAVFPGMPFIPFFILSVITASIYFFLRKEKDPASEAIESNLTAPETDSVSDLLSTDDIHLSVAPNLISIILDPIDGLEVRIDSLRKHIVKEYGIVIPEVRITDDTHLASGEYQIRILGVREAKGVAEAHKLLVLSNDIGPDFTEKTEVREPVFGSKAYWISANRLADLESQGISAIKPVEMISTHLLEIIKDNLSRLLTMRALNDLLSRVSNTSDIVKSQENQRVISEIIPDQISKELLISILRLLLDEHVSIKNLIGIIEVVAEVAQYEKSKDLILERVRQKISNQILERLRDNQEILSIITLDKDWEALFDRHSIATKGFPTVNLPPEVFNHLVECLVGKTTELAESKSAYAFVTSQIRRRFIQTILSSKGIDCAVLSFEEIARDKNIALAGSIPVPEAEAA